jgi:hypothetical protein
MRIDNIIKKAFDGTVSDISQVVITDWSPSSTPYKRHQPEQTFSCMYKRKFKSISNVAVWNVDFYGRNTANGIMNT